MVGDLGGGAHRHRADDNHGRAAQPSHALGTAARGDQMTKQEMLQKETSAKSPLTRPPIASALSREGRGQAVPKMWQCLTSAQISPLPSRERAARRSRAG